MRSDRGIGLIEVLVAMTLLMVALAMFGLAFSTMMAASDASGDIGTVTDEVRVALHGLDRQVRSGYWVKDLGSAVAGASSAVLVLTQDPSGTRQCWIWALRADGTGLIARHYPEAGGASWVGTSVTTPGWQSVVGGETGLGSVALGPGSALSGFGEVKALRLEDFSRAALFQGVAANIVVAKGDHEPVAVGFRVAVRNIWRAAPFATGCD